VPDRIVRVGILTSDSVNLLSWPAEVLYRRLHSVVDDYGRYDGRSAMLRAHLYPLKIDKVSEADVGKWLTECVTAGLVSLYRVAGRPYVEVLKFGARVRAETSKWPSPDDADKPLQTSADICPQPHADAAVFGGVVAVVVDSSPPSVKKRAPAAPPPGPSVAELMEAGFDEQTAVDFIAHKAKVKAPLTHRAWADHLREATKAGWTPLAAAEKVMAKSWKGFEAKYVADESPSGAPKSTETSFTRDRKAQGSAWMGSAAPKTGEIIDMENSNVTRLAVG